MEPCVMDPKSLPDQIFLPWILCSLVSKSMQRTQWQIQTMLVWPIQDSILFTQQ
jgi:hypothetical protein